MCKSQRISPERKLAADGLFTAVSHIPVNRSIDRGKLDAYLMSSARIEIYFGKRKIVAPQSTAK